MKLLHVPFREKEPNMVKRLNRHPVRFTVILQGPGQARLAASWESIKNGH